jgi:hypothetical protein
VTVAVIDNWSQLFERGGEASDGQSPGQAAPTPALSQPSMRTPTFSPTSSAFASILPTEVVAKPASGPQVSDTPTPGPIASRLLRLTSPTSRTMTITGPVLGMSGRVLGELPVGYEVWSATRKFNPLDGERLSGPDIGLDAEGPCSVNTERFDCGPVTIGDGRESGEYRAYIVLAPPHVAELFRAFQAEQRRGIHEGHKIPHDATGLEPVTVHRGG